MRVVIQGGQREIVLGVDDELLARAEKEGASRRIPRDDVAALAVAALQSDAAKNRRALPAAATEASITLPATILSCCRCFPASAQRLVGRMRMQPLEVATLGRPLLLRCMS